MPPNPPDPGPPEELPDGMASDDVYTESAGRSVVCRYCGCVVAYSMMRLHFIETHMQQPG